MSSRKESKNSIKVLKMHVKFHFLKESQKNHLVLWNLEVGENFNLIDFTENLLISPYNILSKWRSSFYLRKSHHRNLTTNYAIKKPVEMVRDLDSTLLCLTTFQGNYSATQKRQQELAFWAGMHCPGHLFKSSSFFEGMRFIFLNQRDFTFHFKMCLFVIV